MPNMSTVFNDDELETLRLDNESQIWNNNLNFDLPEPSSGINEWLDNIFNDGFLNSSNKTEEEAKEDFNRVLEEWKIHLGDVKTGNELQDLHLDDVVSLDNICCLNDNGSGSRSVDVLIKGDLETKGQQQVDTVLDGNDFALEAFDLASLLEKFEASGGWDPIIKAEKNTKLPNSFLPKETKKSCGGRHVDDRFKSNSKVSCGFKAKPKGKELFKTSDGRKHVLPVAQLPRFSIILKRDPISVLEDVAPTIESYKPETALQEHDYCSSSCRFKKRKRSSSSAMSTTDVFAGRKMRSVLRQQSDIKNTVVKDELYSKLPEYYTELAPHKSPTQQENPNDEKLETKDDENSLDSVEDDCFDKLPSYITGIATVSVDAPIPSDNVTSTTANVPKDPIKVGSGSKVPFKRKVRQQNKKYFYLCSDDSRDGSENIGPYSQRSHMKRYVSSRSPSNSDSSSRSRSRSRSPPRSFASSRSRSCSLSRSGSEISDEAHKRNSYYKHRTKSKEDWFKVKEHETEEEKKKQIEDRRVIHVGNINFGTTRAELRKRFGIFGPIEKLNVHHREHGDCFAFITFVYKVDAFKALEHGNDNPTLPKYELSLGGRRLFCLENYSDLDSVANRNAMINSAAWNDDSNNTAFDFDALLNAAKSKLKSGTS